MAELVSAHALAAAGDVAAFREYRGPWDASLSSAAAEGGHLELLKFLREAGCAWDEDVCSYAADGGHLEVRHFCRFLPSCSLRCASCCFV